MFTLSIQKKEKVQVRYKNFHNPSHAEITDNVRVTPNSIGMTNHLQELAKNTVSETLSISGGIEQELDRFGIQCLKRFFKQYPSAWYDLKRKIHDKRTKKEKDGTITYRIDRDAEEFIFSIFLRLGREEGTGNQLEGYVRKEIFENKELIRHASRESSIIDSSHADIISLQHSMNKSERVEFIRFMIRYGILTNSDTHQSDINATFTQLFPTIRHYLAVIFKISFDGFNDKADLNTVAKYIEEKIWGKNQKGNQAKNAWMIVKAFSAWGAYERIYATWKEATDLMSKIPEKLKAEGIILSDIQTEKIPTIWGTPLTVHTASAHLTSDENIHWKYEYRVKSLESILLKMWENEDYNNMDALRDMIGDASIWKDDKTEVYSMSIIPAFASTMANKGYQYKSKGLLSLEKSGQVGDILRKGEKAPLGTIAQDKKAKSAKGFRNVSLSGYSEIEGKPVGSEHQFFDQSGYEFWKGEHYLLDPRKIVSAWSRGSWFFTPAQLLGLIMEIPRSILDDHIKMRPQELLYRYLEDGFVLAYIGKDNEVYLTPKQHQAHFEAKFPSTRPISIRKNNKKKGGARERRTGIDQFKEFILNLRTTDVSRATP